jgi:hypothetical protein
VEQVEVEPIGAQAAEALLARSHGAGAAGVLRQHLRGEVDLVAPALDRLGHHLFDPPAAVHLGGVDVRHAQVETAPQRGHARGPVVALHLPGSLPDHRHPGAGLSHLAKVHSSRRSAEAPERPAN